MASSQLYVYIKLKCICLTKTLIKENILVDRSESDASLAVINLCRNKLTIKGE